MIVIISIVSIPWFPGGSFKISSDEVVQLRKCFKGIWWDDFDKEFIGLLKPLFFIRQNCLIDKHGIFSLYVVLNISDTNYAVDERREPKWTKRR